MRVDQTRFRPDPTSTSTQGAEAAQPLLRLFRPHRERKAVSVRLLRPHRGRKAVSASVRLLRPHRGRKAVSALSRCAVSHLECHICRSRFGIVKKKYRHCNLATPDPSPPTRPHACSVFHSQAVSACAAVSAVADSDDCYRGSPRALLRTQCVCGWRRPRP